MDIGQEKLLDLTYLSINDSDYQFSEQNIQLLSRSVCEILGLSQFELSVSIVDEKTIQELNSKYRNKDKPTDVLSFPQISFDELPSYEKPLESKSSNKTTAPSLLGDVIICAQVASANAQKIGQSLQDEICFLMIHGILHLCGYDHEAKEDEVLMLKQQKLMMQNLKQRYLNEMKGLVTS